MSLKLDFMAEPRDDLTDIRLFHRILISVYAIDVCSCRIRWCCCACSTWFDALLIA